MIYVGYDLRTQGQDYSGIRDAIAAIPSKSKLHCMQSAYLLDTHLSADEIAENLKQYIDSNDILMVFEVPSDIYGQFPSKTDTWIRRISVRRSLDVRAAIRRLALSRNRKQG